MNDTSRLCLLRYSCHGCRPQVVCERLGQVVHEEQIRVDMMQQRPVVSELFSSVCAEIRDEVGSRQGQIKASMFSHLGTLM